MKTTSDSSDVLGLYRALAGGRTPKYPWATMPVGHSFAADCSLSSAKQLVYRNSKGEKKFKCYRHENGIVEIGRIA